MWAGYGWRLVFAKGTYRLAKECITGVFGGSATSVSIREMSTPKWPEAVRCPPVNSIGARQYAQNLSIASVEVLVSH
jgi:hypothetical protein